MRTKNRLRLMGFLIMLLAVRCTAQKPEGAAPPPTQDSTARPGVAVSVEDDVPYASVNGTELRLDIYAPAERGREARPAVVLIHGGGWTSFDKGTMRGMGDFLARAGFVAFSVDYRLFHDGQNRWPAQLDDVQRAVRWVRSNAARYGVDPERIGAFGHSAGGQLAALLGMENTRDNSDRALASYSSRVEAVVDVSGPSDFTTERDPDGETFLRNFLGADRAKDPAIWRQASPVFQVEKSDAPFLIVHGTQDQNVPIGQAQELVDKLGAAGVPVTFVKLEDVHTFRTPEARRALAMNTLAFFRRYLAVPN
ncbi:MAG TPA: alpha/beta hydrolase [Candidatus Cybelea sp.]|nr:alpha/beta hydrolase [Candidatus Cybelea sp.]